jgi:hypothetical protein
MRWNAPGADEMRQEGRPGLARMTARLRLHKWQERTLVRMKK